MEFFFTYHPAWLVLAVAIAFAFSYFLYRKDRLLEEVSITIIRIMAFLRFAFVFLICVLLLGLVLERLIEKKERPLLFIANDVSESVVATQDSTYYREDFSRNLSDLSDYFEEKFDVIEYSFDEDIQNGFTNDYSGKTTDLSHLFNSIFDQYNNRNIGGIIVATDGIYNSGSNPIYTLDRKSFVPVFTIGLGDTTEKKDVQIDYVKHNDVAFLGNEFPVEVGVGYTDCLGEEVWVEILKNDQSIIKEKVKFNQKNGRLELSFNLKATAKGYQMYTVRVSQLTDEFTVKNNASNFYMDVIDGRQKLLILHAGPHPDISALKYVVDNNKNYEVEVKSEAEVSSIQNNDLVILHNYQGKNAAVKKELTEGICPALFIAGNQSDFAVINEMNLGLSGRRTDFEETSFKHNTAFKEILLTPEIVNTISDAPPLQSPFGTMTFSSAIDVLAYQQVGNIVLEKPLIYFFNKSGNRNGVIMGEGIWRWRLHDQLKNGGTKNFEEFISKLITYLALKENKDPFRVKLENEYNESQSVIVKAELYNKSYELVNEPDVTFEFSKEGEGMLKPSFKRVGSAYQLDLGKLTQGVYSWKAETNFQGKQFEKEGTFLVRELRLEQLNIQADHRLLKNLAKKSGGNFYRANQLNELKNEIDVRDDFVTVVYQEKSFDDLIDYKWLFILIMAFMAAEWFFRKFNGAY